jgi:hypothetical protein
VKTPINPFGAYSSFTTISVCPNYRSNDTIP